MRAYTDSKDAIWNNLIKAIKKTCSFDIPLLKKKTQREINFVSMYIKNVHLDVFVNKTLQIVYIHSFLVYMTTWLMIVLSIFLFFLNKYPYQLCP